MRLLEIIAVSLIVLLVFMAALFGRREFFARTGGTVELYFRLNQREGRGWAPGFALFRGDQLRWYRLFSLAPGPRRRLSRRTLTVESRRPPTAEEAFLVPAEWMVLRCKAEHEIVEVAMARPTVTGFLSWLESVTPYST
ncbi:MAG TPA: DUF2550 domain-containing protein [Candidatus Limnocylindrales bacterium]|nr:DUF2550 domain-containing protein [Candidatus Limnocylindrales bacterium]